MIVLSFQNVEYKIFFFQFKLGRKAAETARYINEAFGPGTTTECTAQWWFKKFCGGDKSLEDDGHSGWPSDVDNDQLRALVEANPRTTVQELASELDVTYTMISNHLREIGKTKKLDKWVPHKLKDNQKKRRYEVSSSLLLRTKNHPFLDQVMTCNEKLVLYNNWRHSAPRHFSKPKLHQKKVILTVWWAATGLIHYSFFECRRNHYGGEVLSTNEWNASETLTTTPSISQQKKPTLLNQACRSWTNWATKLYLIRHTLQTSHLPTTTFSSILITFCVRNASKT